MDYIYAKDRTLFCGETPLLLRGFGLGGWFLPEGYMWKLYTKCDRPRRMEALIETLCGKDYADAFWETYFESYITEFDIEQIALRGYNSVRMPLNARKLYELIDGRMRFNKAAIDRLDRLVAWCRKWQIYVILDMHGAPGGQTGANIDDSAHDRPELFTEEHYEDELIELWRMLALRYKDEPAVAGYDLLNEPLPNWFSEHNDKLMPLYAKLIDVIRTVDTKHLIILEGLHWSTDFSIFESLPAGFSMEGILLEFHKYWSNPDEESLSPFLEVSKHLNVPLFMGEGGENNHAWYTTIFPLYERLGISWSFWTYKKMDCDNSPVTFEKPENWQMLIDYIDQTGELSSTEAIKIFDSLLEHIKNTKVNEAVYNALDRRVPLLIPAEAYDAFECHSERMTGANLRTSDSLSILFESGKMGDVDYKRYGGEPQPDEENLVVCLKPSDSVLYDFKNDFDQTRCDIVCYGEGALKIDVQNASFNRQITEPTTLVLNVPMNKNERASVKISCQSGIVYLDTIELFRGNAHENYSDPI